MGFSVPLLQGPEAMHALEQTLLNYRQAEVALMEALQEAFPRDAALTVTYPMEERGGEAGAPEAVREPEECATVLVAVQTADVLHNIAVQVRLERSGKVIELPLWILLSHAVM